MTEETRNLSLNPINENTRQRKKTRSSDSNLFKEEFKLANDYFEKLPYFGYFLSNPLLSYNQEKSSVLNKVNSFNKENENFVDREKMGKASFQKKDTYKSVSHENGFKFRKDMLNLDKGYLKIALGNTLLFVPLNNISNQYGYDYILNLFRQAVKIEEIANNIVEKASLLKDGESSELTIKLKPEFLGELSIKLTIHDGKLEVAILASEEIKRIIENDLEKLKNNLLNSNLHVDKLIIMSQDEQRRQNGNYKYFKHFLGDDEEDQQGIRDNINPWYLPSAERYSAVNYII